MNMRTVWKRINRILLAVLCIFTVCTVSCASVFAADAAEDAKSKGKQVVDDVNSKLDSKTEDITSGGGSAGTPNAYYLRPSVKKHVDSAHSFYKDNSTSSFTDLGRILGSFLAKFNFDIASTAYNTLFVNAYKALGFTRWYKIIQNFIFGGNYGYRVALIGFLTIGMVILGIQMLYRQEEMVSSRRAVVKQIIAVILIIFGLPFFLSVLSSVAFSGAQAATFNGQTRMFSKSLGDADNYFNNVVRNNTIDWLYVAARGGLGVADGSRKAPANSALKKVAGTVEDAPPNELTGAIYVDCLKNTIGYGAAKSYTGDINYIDPSSISVGLQSIAVDEKLTEKTVNTHKEPAAMVATLARQYNEDVMNSALSLGRAYGYLAKEANRETSDVARYWSSRNLKSGWHPSFDQAYDDYVRYTRDAELIARSIAHYWPTNKNGVIINAGKKNSSSGDGPADMYVETKDEGTKIIAPASAGYGAATVQYGTVLPINKVPTVGAQFYKMFYSKNEALDPLTANTNSTASSIMRQYCGQFVLIKINDAANNQELAEAINKGADAGSQAGDKITSGVKGGIKQAGNGIEALQDKVGSGIDEGLHKMGNNKGMITFNPVITAHAADKKDTDKDKKSDSKTNDANNNNGTDSDTTDILNQNPDLTAGLSADGSSGSDSDQNSITSVALMDPKGTNVVNDPRIDPYAWKGLNTDGSLQDTVKAFLLHDKEGHQVDSSGKAGEQMAGSKVAPYYRYSIDFFAIATECFVLALAYVALAYKILRTIFDIVLTSIVAPFFASVDFATQGTKTKEIIKGLVQAYTTLLFYPIMIDVYMIGCSYIQRTWGGQDTKLFYLLILFAWSIAIMDTPVILGNLLGQQTQRSFMNDISTLATGVNNASEFVDRNAKRLGKAGLATARGVSALLGNASAFGGKGAAALVGAAAAIYGGKQVKDGAWTSDQLKNYMKGVSDKSSNLEKAEAKSLGMRPQRAALGQNRTGKPPEGSFFNQPVQKDTKSALAAGKAKGALPAKGAVAATPLMAHSSDVKAGALAGASAGASSAAKAKANGTSSKNTSTSTVSHQEAAKTTALHTVSATAAGAAAGTAAGRTVSSQQTKKTASTQQANRNTVTNENQTKNKTSRTSTVDAQTRIRQERAAVISGASAGAAAGAAAGSHTADVSAVDTTRTSASKTSTAAISEQTSAGAHVMPDMNTASTAEPVTVGQSAVAAGTVQQPAGAMDMSSSATHHQTIINERTMETREQQIHQQSVQRNQSVQQTVTQNTSVSGTSVPAPQLAQTAASISTMSVPFSAGTAEPVYADTMQGSAQSSQHTVNVMHQTMPGETSTTDMGNVSTSASSSPIHQNAVHTVNVMMQSSPASGSSENIHQNISMMAASPASQTVHQTVTVNQANAGSPNQTVHQTTVVQGQAASGGQTTVHETVVRQESAASSGGYSGGSFDPEVTTHHVHRTVMSEPRVQHVEPNGYTQAPASPVTDMPSQEPVEDTIFGMLGGTTAASAASFGEQAAEILRSRAEKAKSYASTAPSLKKNKQKFE